MRYRNSECCITPEELSSDIFKAEGCNRNYDDDNWYRKDKCKKDNDYDDMCNNDNNCTENLMRKLSELQFAAIDLNLYLDTHPWNEEALAMFKKITKTMETVKMDYIRKYGPLKACDSADKTPFEWTSCEFKWPWEK